MITIYTISLILNLLFIAVFIYLAISGKQLIRNIFFKYVIAVRHDQKVSMFNATPILNGVIIFLGDSLTEGGNWSELFPDRPILNRGIGGDISEGVLKRLDEVIRHQPSKVFVCIGTNDIAKGISQEVIIKNYRAILQTMQSQSPATKIYVQSLFPVGQKVITGHSNEKILPLNAEIKKLCSEMNVAYIDLHPNFTDENGYLKSAYTNDSLHLMGNGYLVWQNLIKHYVYE